jgi:hypothetical protein
MSRVFVEDNNTQISYYFDITFKETHTHMNEITQNPVQDGANINDHVYQQPILFTWDVGMSDCLTSFVPDQFDGASQRSVAAFDVLESLWKNSPLLTITTSFKQYRNMLIKSFVVTRDKHTRFGMKATVVFQQVIVTAATDIPVTAKQSSDPQTTEKNNTGAKAAAPSAAYKTLTISENYLGGAYAKYQGKSIPLTTYFQTYSSDHGKFKAKSMEVPDFVVTPTINSTITNNTEFVIDGKTLSYAQLLNTYGK